MNSINRINISLKTIKQFNIRGFPREQSVGRAHPHSSRQLARSFDSNIYIYIYIHIHIHIYTYIYIIVILIIYIYI